MKVNVNSIVSQMVPYDGENKIFNTITLGDKHSFAFVGIKDKICYVFQAKWSSFDDLNEIMKVYDFFDFPAVFPEGLDAAFECAKEVYENINGAA